MPRKTLQSECRVSCDLAHVSVTAVKLKNVYVQCVTFNYRYFGRIYAYTELCLQASTSLHLSEYITKWPLVRYHGKIFLEKRVQGDIQGHFRPPIYCSLYPPSFHLPPSPNPSSKLCYMNLSRLLGRLLRNSVPPFSLLGVGEV